MKPLLALGVALPLLALAERSGHACSPSGEQGILRSVPASGDERVSTDVVPWVVTGYEEPRLVDAAGDVVPTTLERRVTTAITTFEVGFEVFPVEPLSPNTQYRLEVDPPTEELREGTVTSVVFTTGDGALASPLPTPPELAFVALNTEAVANTCIGVYYRACIATEHAGLLEVRFSSGTWVYVDHPAQLLQLPLGNLPTEECVEVRARDSAGHRSEPWVRCVTEGQLRLESDPSRNDMFVCDRPEVQALLTREGAGAASSVEQPTPSSDAGTPDDEDGAAPSQVEEAAVPIGEGAENSDAPATSVVTDAGTPSVAAEPRAQAVDDTQDDGGCAFTAPSARSRGSLGLLYLAVALGGVAFHRRCRRVCGTALAELCSEPSLGAKLCQEDRACKIECSCGAVQCWVPALRLSPSQRTRVVVRRPMGSRRANPGRAT